MSMSSSEANPSTKTELETVVNWPLVVSAASLAFVALAVPIVLACLAALKRDTVKDQVASPPATAKSRPIKAAVVEKLFAPVERAKPAETPTPLQVYVEPDRPRRLPAPASAAVAIAPPRVPDPVLQVPEVEMSPFLRLDGSSEEALIHQMAEAAKEVDLETVKGTRDKLLAEARAKVGTDRSRASVRAKQQQIEPTPVDLKSATSILALRKERPDLRGLPMREGADCQVNADVALKRDAIAKHLSFLHNDSRIGFVSYSGRGFAAAEAMRENSEWFRGDTLSILMQMLQIEDVSTRSALVNRVSKMRSSQATDLLIRHALFDLAPTVREESVKALKDRDPEEYRQALLDGLRYPWPPMAAHAAEALAALEDRSAIPYLVDLLDAPNPCEPVENTEKKWVVRELVRVNHLRNCLLCHAPSSSVKDPLRGIVPTPGSPLPRVYYAGQRGDFVRADVVYLRQDFSAMERVAKPEKWPEWQRFDYLVRTRELTADELAAHKNKTGQRAVACYPQREAVLFALRQLTGIDAGDKSADWYDLLWSVEAASPN